MKIKKSYEVNIKPDTAERRRELTEFNWLKTVADTKGLILSAFDLWFTKTMYVRIFIITNTMHTIGVDKITLFKTT